MKTNFDMLVKVLKAAAAESREKKLQLFLDECCWKDEKATVLFWDLFKAYVEFCARMGLQDMESCSDLIDRVGREHGVATCIREGRVVCVGIGLKDASFTPDTLDRLAKAVSNFVPERLPCNNCEKVCDSGICPECSKDIDWCEDCLDIHGFEGDCEAKWTAVPE